MLWKGKILKQLHPSSASFYAEGTEWQAFGNVLRFFNQKEEQLTVRKHSWFAWAFEMHLLTKKNRYIG